MNIGRDAIFELTETQLWRKTVNATPRCPISLPTLTIAILILLGHTTANATAAVQLNIGNNSDPVAIALNDIFGDAVIAENVAGVTRAARKISSEQRFETLRNHVLPSKTHSGIRLIGLQTATSPIPSRIGKEPLDIERLKIAAETKQQRVSVGGNVVSPAFDLVRVAQKLGRLGVLRESVLQLNPTSEDQQRCRLVMLALIELQRGDTQAAGTAFDEFEKNWRVHRESSLAKRWPETLLVWSTLEHGALLSETRAMLFDIITKQIRPGSSPGPAQWDALISNLFGRVHTPRNLGAELSVPALHPYGSNPPLKRWHPVSHCHAWTHGTGVPPAVWQLRNGVVSNPASHDTEFLFYEVPLLGDYVLECECTCFGYEDTHPFVAGTWLAPVWDHSAFNIGGLKTVRPNAPFEPLLTRVDEWLRYRIEINDDVCRRYINGRFVHEETLSEHREPWIAIRSPQFGRGNVRDLRITGNPRIPESVNLTACTNSQQDTAAHQRPWPTGWYPWLSDDRTTPQTSWQTQTTSGQPTVIGQHTPELAGTAAEQLLTYHWPIVGDSNLRWEFFYREGQSLVCPALGRKAFLLHSDGVQWHWVTNGIWDGSDVDPAGRYSSPVGEQSRAVPLQNDAWNSAELEIQGDRLLLEVNGQQVYSGDIHATNDRRFGMFHFSDQTQAMFRNVVLTGDWPNTLPNQTKQQLRDSSVDPLNQQRLELTASFEFDFANATDDEISDHFLTYEGYADRPATVTKLKTGLKINLTGPANTQACLAYCAPRIVVSGDYDIIAEYTDLELTVSGKGSSAIYLANNYSGTRMFQLYRGVVEYPKTPAKQLAQAEIYDQQHE